MAIISCDHGDFIVVHDSRYTCLLCDKEQEVEELERQLDIKNGEVETLEDQLRDAEEELKSLQQ